MHYDGKRDRARRQAVERGEYNELRPLSFRGYSKQGLTYAAKVPQEFTVETPEGVMMGNAGDYLAVGASGEMYPIAADIFEATYRQAGAIYPMTTVTPAQAKGQVTTADAFTEPPEPPKPVMTALRSIPPTVDPNAMSAAENMPPTPEAVAEAQPEPQAQITTSDTVTDDDGTVHVAKMGRAAEPPIG